MAAKIEETHQINPSDKNLRQAKTSSSAAGEFVLGASVCEISYQKRHKSLNVNSSIDHKWVPRNSAPGRKKQWTAIKKAKAPTSPHQETSERSYTMCAQTSKKWEGMCEIS